VSTVRVERDGRIAWVTLDRADAANALSKALVRDLRAALAELRSDPAVLIVTGAGEKAFCAGADLKERRAMTLEETRAFLVELVCFAIRTLGIATVAHGWPLQGSNAESPSLGFR